MAETSKQKNDRRRQEATVYRIQEDFGSRSGVYRITKRIIDVEVEIYHVTLRNTSNGLDMWCDCPGYRRQKFAHERHKHIRAVKDYVHRGSPKHADYKFTGVGEKTKIKFIRMEE